MAPPVIESGSILVRGIQFRASHGISAEEQRAVRRFQVDLEIEATEAIAHAGASDRLQDTVDYVEVCALVIRTGTEESCRLLETVASRILRAILARYPNTRVTLTLTKIDPPCPGSPEASAVRLTGGPLRT